MTSLEPTSSDHSLYKQLNGNRCVRCCWTVDYEHKVGPIKGAVFHKKCFTCFECKQRLSKRTYYTNFANPEDKEIYCRAHIKGTLPTHSYPDHLVSFITPPETHNNRDAHPYTGNHTNDILSGNAQKGNNRSDMTISEDSSLISQTSLKHRDDVTTVGPLTPPTSPDNNDMPHDQSSGEENQGNQAIFSTQAVFVAPGLKPSSQEPSRDPWLSSETGHNPGLQGSQRETTDYFVACPLSPESSISDYGSPLYSTIGEGIYGHANIHSTSLPLASPYSPSTAQLKPPLQRANSAPSKPSSSPYSMSPSGLDNSLYWKRGVAYQKVSPFIENAKGSTSSGSARSSISGHSPVFLHSPSIASPTQRVQRDSSRMGPPVFIPSNTSPMTLGSPADSQDQAVDQYYSIYCSRPSRETVTVPESPCTTQTTPQNRRRNSLRWMRSPSLASLSGQNSLKVFGHLPTPSPQCTMRIDPYYKEQTSEEDIYETVVIEDDEPVTQI